MSGLGRTRHHHILYSLVGLICALFLFAPVIGQTVEDPCTTLKGLSGSINGTFTPELCWRIVPFVSSSRRPVSLTISFPEFNLGENSLTIYTSDSPVTGEVYNTFYGNEALDTAVIDSPALFLYLKGSAPDCTFHFQYQAGSKTEFKTAIVVLISVVIMMAIPFICIRIAICTQTAKIKQKQLQQPEFGTRRRLVALWSGLSLGLLIMVLLLSRKAGL